MRKMQNFALLDGIYYFNIREVGEPCSIEGSVRLVGGIDQFQGRVEICTLGIYSAVCHNRWDVQDAQVICSQLSLSSKSSSWVCVGNFICLLHTQIPVLWL